MNDQESVTAVIARRIWEESPERREWAAKLVGLVEGEERIERLTGMEFLFADQLHPKAYKMALLLIFVLFAMSLVVDPVVTLLFSALPTTPDMLVLLFRVVLQVLLMTYVVMPWVTRLLLPWLTRYG